MINSKRQRGQRPRFEGLIFIFPPCLYSFMLLFSRRPEKWKATCLFIHPCASLWGFSGPGLCMGVSPEPGSGLSSHWITCVTKLKRSHFKSNSKSEIHDYSCFYCRRWAPTQRSPINWPCVLSQADRHSWPKSGSRSTSWEMLCSMSGRTFFLLSLSALKEKVDWQNLLDKKTSMQFKKTRLTITDLKVNLV